MKRIIRIFFLFFMLIIFAQSAKACHYKFDSKSTQVKKGEIVQVKVTIIYEHRRCVIELDDTQFKFHGLKLIDASEWVKEKRGTYSKILKLKAVEPGQAKLEVIRECSKKGISADEWKIKVLPSA